MQRVLGGGADDDGGAVLVIMENGDVHALAADLLDYETVGRLDVFEVDRAKAWLHRADDLGQFLGVGLIKLDVETVDIGELLEEHGLALHHRFRGQRADIAQPQHRGAIADHGHQIAARGIARGGVGVVLDLDAGLGHAR